MAAAFLAGLILRLVGLTYPPYDDHSFRQTQTLSTIENYHSQGIDLLYPKTIYMGYPGTFVLELPLFQAVGALLYDVFGQHLEIIRLMNILMGAGAAWMVFRITWHFIDRRTATMATLLYWLAPLNITYQRSMLIDPTAVFFGLFCFYQLALLLSPLDRENHSGRVSNWTLFVISTLLTAMIKALYLLPAVLLLLQQLMARRFRFDRRILQVGVVFAVAGACFLIWNHHATVVNESSPFTDGVKPTSLLGFSALLAPEFYNAFLLHRPKRELGLIGLLLYPIGLWAAWFHGRKWPHFRSLLLIVLIPPTYLLCFANINRPHDYYQLIITPFLAIVSGYG
ncbi:MAG: glycosyltransferase family 39 protein, partial [Verrucomicrobiota bacterium]